jgi:arylsulfatase A-like enzyme
VLEAGQDYGMVPVKAGLAEAAPRRSFVVNAGALVVRGTEEGAPTLEVWEYVDPGWIEAGAANLCLGWFQGEGILLAPDLAAEVELDAGPCRLYFSSAAQGMPGRCEMRVSLDGAKLLSKELEVVPEAPSVAHQIEFPKGARGRLRFEIAGALALVGLLAPRLVPLDAPSAPPKPPDIMLFIADTYRADNLSAGGREAWLAPHLEEFSKKARVFTRAFAPAPWTLPSHAALFSSLYPPQACVTTAADALPAGARTLAEVLRAEGYRTLAVTDDAYVSPQFGLAQGFEHFEARRRSAQETVDATRVLLRDRDQRPVFLVVHTYRAHHPYVVDRETRAAMGERLGLAPGLDLQAFAEVPESIAGWTPEHRPTSAEAERMAGFEALYRGASADLDRLFGKVLEVLVSERVLPGAFVVFTSDHGEAFWEHGIAEHGNGVWNEHLAVPFLVAGPGIAPGRSESLASLIDVAPMVCGLVGVRPDPSWRGLDLLRVERTGPLFAFQGPGEPMAMFQGPWKLVFPDSEAETPSAAFDLSRDASEARNRSTEAEAAKLSADFRAERDAATGPLFQAESSRPDAKSLAELEALGYGGK